MNETVRLTDETLARRKHRRLVLCLFATWAIANLSLWYGPDIVEYVQRYPEERKLDSIEAFYTAGNVQVVSDSGDGESQIPYLLFIPRQTKPDSVTEDATKYPLVVMLHGAGNRGIELRKHLRWLGTFLVEDDWQSRHPRFVVAPQCPENMSWVYSRNFDMPSTVDALVSKLIREHPIDVDRIYLAGNSMGGYGCWRIGALYPERFAAILPVAGRGDPETATRLVNMPCWAVHGELDEVVPTVGSIEMVKAIRDAGGDPKLSIIEGVEHRAWEPVREGRDEYFGWLFEQRRSQSFPLEREPGR